MCKTSGAHSCHEKKITSDKIFIGYARKIAYNNDGERIKKSKQITRER